MSERNNLRAAREQLKAEREQIIEAAVQSGAAIRVPVAVVANRGHNLEELKERKLAELRMAGEKREVFFDELMIDTGVERDPNYGQNVSVDEPPKERVRAPEGEALRAEGFQAQNRPQPIRPSVQESRRIWTQTEQPSESNPGGAIVQGSFIVRDGMVYVYDAQGQPCGRLAVNPGDDVEMVAKRLLREKTTSNGFNRPLQYPRSSIH